MSDSQRIAIVGIGGIFPGADSLAQFHENILNGISSAREPEVGRWALSVDDVYARDISPDKVRSRRACFVDDFEFDAAGLNVAAGLIEKLDPMYLIGLRAAKEAWGRTVTAGVDRKRAGVIIGNIALPTDASSAMADELFGPMFEAKVLGKAVGNAKLSTCGLNRYVAGLPGGLIAKALGLGGGAHTLDAACASSLYALKYAADELLAGRADVMIAGGMSRPDSLYTQMGFSQLGAVSPSGICSPFDEKADGLVVGEGAGMMVLKRLDDAVAAGDKIYATIAGIGLSNDIDGSLMQPDVEGQLRAMRGAYELAGWQPSDVQLIECHGTGTPVGDAVEFESLRQLWKNEDGDRKCVIGSVKSNVGHLLTGAGAAGLIKVLMAMEDGVLPPTANYENANGRLGMGDSSFEVLSEAMKWKAGDDGVKRAAVSAFGFGGINAHVLLEEWVNGVESTNNTHNNPSVIPSPTPGMRRGGAPLVAIVGMGTHFGEWDSLKKFEQRVMGGGEDVELRQPGHWWGLSNARDYRGYFIGEVAMPVGRFRIPPTELKDMLPQQLLMLQVAADALEDSGLGIDTRDSQARRTDWGVYIGIGLDLNTTNFHFRWTLLNRARRWAEQLGLNLSDEALAGWVEQLRDAAGPALSANRTMGALGGIVASRVARAFRIGGPSFTVSSEETSGLHALQTAVRALQAGEIDHAVVGAVDLAGDLRAVLGDNERRKFAKNEARVLSEDGDGVVIGEGAAAVVVKRYEDAVANGDRIYAVVRGVGGSTSGDVTGDGYAASVDRALEDGDVSRDSIGMVEAYAGGDIDEDEAEVAGLGKVFAGCARDIDIAIGSVKADIGHTGAAGGLASVVKASLCLHQRMQAGVRGLKELRSGFGEKIYGGKGSQYWLADRADGVRRALVGALSVDGNCEHVVLEESGRESDVATADRGIEVGLFGVTGIDEAGLTKHLEMLSSLAGRIEGGDVRDLATRWWREHGESNSQGLSVGIVAQSIQELLTLISRAKQAVKNGMRLTDDGVYYSPDQLGIEGDVAFVYPGSGNDFIGMGKDLGVGFPEVLRRLDSENERLASQFASGKYWTKQTTQGFTHKDYIFGQVWLGTFVSDIVAGFGVMPDAVIGYSLGETAGMFSTRSWTSRDEMLERIKDSTLFTADLAERCEAVRETWALSEGEEVDWVLGVVNRSATEIREHLGERVYLLIVNTPSECVIGGDRGAVEQLVKELACVFHSITGVTTVHCEVAKPVEKAYRDLHLFETNPPRDVRIYSGIWGKRYEVNRESIADSIVGQAVEPFDYTKVIESAYADGVRVFLEMGPGGSCTRMIDQILGDRAHVAKAVCMAGQDSRVTLMRVLAQLMAEGVSVDLSVLYGRDREDKVAEKAGAVIKVDVGGKGFDIPAAPRGKVKITAAVEVKEEVAATPVAEVEHAVPPCPAGVSEVWPAVVGDMSSMGMMISQMAATEAAKATVQETFLRLSENVNRTLGQAMSLQAQLLAAMQGQEISFESVQNSGISPSPQPYPTPGMGRRSVAFDRDMCMEFAIGSVGKMLGPEFAEVDTYPTRVRLPDEPLMLVDRIVEVEGEPRSMTNGRVVTEHDIHPGAWYLDCGRIPTCIAVEAGQADLFLSGYLGIDFQSKGLAVYRLLDAVVTFHRELPGPGEVISYDIKIDHFFRQGDTHLFRFNFEATVGGEPLLSMSNGCAGFFTEQELAAGQGIVQTTMDRQAMPGKRPSDWKMLAPVHDKGVIETYSDAQIDALRRGDLVGCFGEIFAGLNVRQPVGLPTGRMTLVHRILSLDMHGGRFGMGQVTGEADIYPDDWFLTCHFSDDRVMPGTLMYECCLHTLRVLLLRMGWVAEAGAVAYEPVPGIGGQLKCRGQVLETTSKVQYEVTIKELGYEGGDGSPYVIADALMSADGRPIVQMKDMSLRLSGLTKLGVEGLWGQAGQSTIIPLPSPLPKGEGGLLPVYDSRPAIFDNASIVAFAEGKPSEAFGDKYLVFDNDRKIARLPRDPYKFLDRVVSIENCEQWVLKAGAVIEAQYDVPADEWYFASNRQAGVPEMPFAVLLEVALQPCGWLAAYLGSALTSETDLKFRNLGGEAVQLLPVTPDIGTLTTTVKMTGVSQSGGMIIQHYDMAMRCSRGEVYRGTTYFGFFTQAALADQVGIREAELYQPPAEVIERGKQLAGQYPDEPPFADERMRMIDRIEVFDPQGGRNGLGYICGKKVVDASDWFFRAHFYEDPVCPGSLGLESFQQLLQVIAVEKWGKSGISEGNLRFESMARGEKHKWVYRGQIIPTDSEVTVMAEVTDVDKTRKIVRADGFLIVDGRIIYQMTDFTVRVTDC